MELSDRFAVNCLSTGFQQVINRRINTLSTSLRFSWHVLCANIHNIFHIHYNQNTRASVILSIHIKNIFNQKCMNSCNSFTWFIPKILHFAENLANTGFCSCIIPAKYYVYHLSISCGIMTTSESIKTFDIKSPVSARNSLYPLKIRLIVHLIVQNICMHPIIQEYLSFWYMLSYLLYCNPVKPLILLVFK